MASLRFSLFFVPLLSRFCLSHVPTWVETCPASFCKFSEPPIRFPFGLTHQQNQSCIYPGFDLSCDVSGRTVINLPKSGEFIVASIDYHQQILRLKDPQGCLPKRLQMFSTSGSPFRAESYVNLTYLNCSADITETLAGYKSVPCLSNKNQAILIKPTVDPWEINTGMDLEGVNPWIINSCEDVGKVEVPRFYDEFLQLSLNPEYIRLTWDHPACGSCGDNIGSCRILDLKTLETSCDVHDDSSEYVANRGSRAMVVGVIIIIVIKSGVFFCIWWRRRRAVAATRRRGQVPILAVMAASRLGQVSVSAATAPAGGQGQQQQQLRTDNDRNPMGMDSPALASYPKIKITENTMPQLRKSGDDANDDACAICLMDYRVNDTVKILPECDHYFHDDCLDNWLRKKATCPLCRKQQLRLTESGAK